MPLSTRSILALLGGFAPAIALPLLFVASRSAAPPPAEAPELLLNEILFDPVGDDASANSSEWVELIATRDFSWGQFRLADSSGTTLAELVLSNVKAGSVLVVYLGTTIPSIHDSDLADGTASFPAMLPPGDHLPSVFSGLTLLDSSGATLDSIYWTTVGSSSIPAGVPPTQVLDLSFSGRPISEGDSIGRGTTPAADHTGTALDWDRHGGRNAAGPTPGGRNGVEVVDTAGLLLWSQHAVSGSIGRFSLGTQHHWLAVVDSGVSRIEAFESPTLLRVVGRHELVVSDHGAPRVLRGLLESHFERNETPGSVAYSLTVRGTLQDASGFGFAIDSTATTSGFHTDATQEQWLHLLTFLDGGSSFPIQELGSATTTRISEEQWSAHETRVVLDYGGAGPKLSNSTTTFRRLADGIYDVECFGTRDWPANPPAVGGSDSIEFVESFHVRQESHLSGDGEAHSSVVQIFDRWADGTLVSTLPTGTRGTTSLRRVGGKSGDVHGEFAFAGDLPRETSGANLELAVACKSSLAVEGRKLVRRGSTEILHGTTSIDSTKLHADPPIQQPAAPPPGHGAPCPTCGGSGQAPPSAGHGPSGSPSSPGGVTVQGGVTVSGTGHTVIIANGSVTITGTPKPPSPTPPTPPSEHSHAALCTHPGCRVITDGCCQPRGLCSRHEALLD